jgi:hypothetical protein
MISLLINVCNKYYHKTEVKTKLFTSMELVSCVCARICVCERARTLAVTQTAFHILSDTKCKFISINYTHYLAT